MKRILIIGHPGAGKTTLAVELGKIMNLPVIHLDQHFWQPGWVKTGQEEWRRKMADMVTGEKWIIDGTYDNSLDIRLPHADTVVFLDFATLTCLWQIIKRTIGNYGKIRPNMPVGCPERIDFEFIKFAWQYRKKRRPNIVESVRKMFDGNELIILKNQNEIARFLERIAASQELTK